MIQSYINTVEGFMLVYAINDGESYESLKTLLNAINKNMSALGLSPTILVVGNKCDLPQDERKVSMKEAKSMCDKMGVLFMETSALVNSN